MKIEKLHNNKVMVSMSESDMNAFNVTPDMLTSDSPRLQLMLFQIMNDVYKKTGFNPYNGQLVVEASYSNENGLVFIITKNEIYNAHRVSSRSVHNGKVRINADKVKNIRLASRNFKKPAVYRFRRFEELRQMLFALPADYHRGNAVYTMSGSYFYIFRPAGASERRKEIIAEYASDSRFRRINTGVFREHGKLVAEDEGLVDLARGIKKMR